LAGARRPRFDARVQRRERPGVSGDRVDRCLTARRSRRGGRPYAAVVSARGCRADGAIR
jgi:hypothetical protein